MCCGYKKFTHDDKDNEVTDNEVTVQEEEKYGSRVHHGNNSFELARVGYRDQEHRH